MSIYSGPKLSTTADPKCLMMALRPIRRLRATLIRITTLAVRGDSVP